MFYVSNVSFWAVAPTTTAYRSVNHLVKMVLFSESSRQWRSDSNKKKDTPCPPQRPHGVSPIIRLSQNFLFSYFSPRFASVVLMSVVYFAICFLSRTYDI